MTVLGLWMQDGFPYYHSNPIFWEQILDLPARQYHYGEREASPTHRRSSVSDALHHVLRRRRTGEIARMHLACNSLSLSLSLSLCVFFKFVF
jgi:hypothetical protein